MRKRIFYIISLLLITLSSYSQLFISHGPVGSAAASPLLDSLFAYYAFEESTGDALDEINSRDLSLNGTVTRQQTGIQGYCYSYGGGDAYLDRATHDFEFTGSWTIGFWMKSNDVTASTRYFVTTFGASNYGYDLWMSSGASAVAGSNYRYTGSNIYMSSSPTTVNDNDWHYLTYSYSEVDDSTKLWVDGNIADKDKMPSAIIYNAVCDFNVGARLSAQYWYYGYIDELAFWRGKELSHAEILLLYNSGSGLAYPLDY